MRGARCREAISVSPRCTLNLPCLRCGWRTLRREAAGRGISPQGMCMRPRNRRATPVQQHHPRHDRLAGKMARQRRMVRGYACRASRSRGDRLERIHQVEQPLARELAALVARQRGDEMQRPRHERRIDVPAQRGAQRALAELPARPPARRGARRRRADRTRRPARRRSRRAPRSAPRAKCACRRSSPGSALRPCRVKRRSSRTRSSSAMRCGSRICPPCTENSPARSVRLTPGQQLPGLVERGAARRDHAGLARAVDLEHRRVPQLLRLLRELHVERHGRAQHAGEVRAAAGARRRRRADAAARSSASAARRPRASAAPRSAGSSGRPGVHRQAVLPRQHHGRFEAEHVLRRHRADDACRCGPDARGERARSRHQRAPGFRMRHRPAGAARGEDDRGDVGGVDRENFAGELRLAACKA